MKKKIFIIIKSPCTWIPKLIVPGFLTTQDGVHATILNRHGARIDGVKSVPWNIPENGIRTAGIQRAILKEAWC